MRVAYSASKEHRPKDLRRQRAFLGRSQAVAQSPDRDTTSADTKACLGRRRLLEMFFEAARQDRDDLLDGLIRSGMNPDERDLRGNTALIIAAYYGHAKVVEVLIRRGANPCAADIRGNSGLMGASVTGEMEIAKHLIAAQCDVNACNDMGQTALMMASLFGRMEVVNLLLANGAETGLRDRAGNTALNLAEQQADRDMIALLKQSDHPQVKRRSPARARPATEANRGSTPINRRGAL
jgi:uncharacterized protein